MLSFCISLRTANRFAIVLAFLAAASFGRASAKQQTQELPSPGNPVAQSVILFIADGFGPASLTLGREFSEHQGRPLALSSIIVGTVGTSSSSSRVTDSAASATAYACGVKTRNGIIAMDDAYRSMVTILEAAESKGMATGLVATSGITHATPAAFSSHVRNRGMAQEIAVQQINAGIDVLLGGGLSNFLPEKMGGLRIDGRNLLKEAAKSGYKIVTSPLVLSEVSESPVIGLFASGHLDYDIDRNPEEQPSLAAMTQKALELLSEDEDGFFLMVEGSRIDHAGHANDPIAHVYDIIAYDKALALALDYAGNHPETLVVSTADHETGGLSLGSAGTYTWSPEVLAGASHSIEVLVERLSDGCDIRVNGCDAREFVRKGLGISQLDTDEEDRLLLAYSEGNIDDVANTLKAIVNRRAGLGWATTGHSGVDVHLGAFGAGAGELKGYHDNDELGRILADLLGLKLGPIVSQAATPGASR